MHLHMSVMRLKTNIKMIISRKCEEIYCLRKFSGGFFHFLSFKTARTVKGIVEREKLLRKADHFDISCPLGIERKKFQIFLAKTAGIVKGVLERKKFQNYLAKPPISLQ